MPETELGIGAQIHFTQQVAEYALAWQRAVVTEDCNGEGEDRDA